MAGFTSLMLTAAMVAAPTPAPAADPMGALLEEIQRDQDRQQYKRAAELAAPASRRSDLRPADRFLLAGLAAESYGEAFQHGGAPRQPKHDPRYLCAQRTALQEAITLTDDPRKHDAVNDTLGKVAAQLTQVAASGRDLPCVLTPIVGTEAGPLPLAETPPPPSTSTATEAPVQTPRPPTARAETSPMASPGPMTPTPPRADKRRVQAGVGTLVPGLLLFAPMAALWAKSSQVEGDLKQLQADTTGRALTDGELERAASLDRQFRGTTAAAAVLGATGAALAVTGLVLLVTRPRSPVAVAPWGARGVGGLVFEGKF